MKVILCLFGVVPRSIKHTYPQLDSKIVKPLKDNFETDIYCFNLNVEDTLVDGRNINQSDCKIIPYDYFEERKQKELDTEINKFCKDGICSIQGKNIDDLRTKNSIRTMYSEYRTSLFLKSVQDKYDTVIVISPDYYPIDTISINDVEKTYECKEMVFTSDQADFMDGYTDGYYIGSVVSIIKIMERYQNLKNYLPSKKNHEWILRRSFEDNNIIRSVTSMTFFKIRANKEVKVLRENDKEYIKLRKTLDK